MNKYKITINTRNSETMYIVKTKTTLNAINKALTKNNKNIIIPDFILSFSLSKYDSKLEKYIPIF